MASATDRVGNTGKADKDRFDLVVDTLKPWVLRGAHGYLLQRVQEPGGSEPELHRADVRQRENGRGSVEDPIAASSLDVRDFIVEGFEVVDIIQPERITDKDKDR